MSTVQTEEVDRVVLRTPIVRIGLLRCPVSHHRFRHPPPTENYALVFPRTAVSVRRHDDVRFVADPSIVAFWNRSQCYSREALSDEGARADWFGFDQSLVLDVTRSFDPWAEDTPDRPLCIPYATTDAVLYLSQRRVISRALSGDVVSPLWFEESVLNLLRHALHNAYAERRVQFAPKEQRRLSIHEEIIHRAEAAMAKHFREPLSLSEIAREAGCSSFHLARLFKRYRNSTLHAHCNTLRLRAALEYVLDTSLDLTQISFEVGFSSHSHFTWAFKRQFGVAPSSLRS
jgi:AraC family transcriptional regulator